MPLNPGIKKVLVIGSGPIVIGQAAEFDYAGTQACRALKEDGLEVVLVNSNPATIMTDSAMADKIYIEPLTLPVLRRIIEKEKPDSILSTLGGQTGLTLSMQLAKEGFLAAHNVRLLGARPDTIERAEDRQLFKETMLKIGQPCIPSDIVNTLEDAVTLADKLGYPVIVRPAFTLGGSGGGIVKNEAELREIADNGLRLSPIHQVLLEKSVAGWKEIEFEVMRDSLGNNITVCSMENLDPVGVHTGDSIVVAPAVTLSDKEYQMLRTAALDIINELQVEGGCNCQFALNPNSFEYAVIEVNPRVSRSSALASKATGYPIAKVAAKIAIGYTLSEIRNAVTGKTAAAFEPALDYVVVKFPKWPFDKFVYAKRDLGTQMKATGEVMAIGTSFEQALMKAVRGAEIGLSDLNAHRQLEMTPEEIKAALYNCTDERLFVIYQAIKHGISIAEIHDITKIDMWFLSKIANIAGMEASLIQGLDDAKYLAAKRLGFPDRVIEKLSGQKIANPRRAVYKMVDTCAAEFAAETPYFYSTYDEENEAAEFLAERKKAKPTVMVLGSGPIRIGQGIEFDYASVHCVWALQRAGYEVAIVNNNPETVSTDFDTADRLYFEPLTEEDVSNIIATEQPYGVVVAFGGQTAIKLTNYLDKNGIRILGTSADSIDRAEDRGRFDELLNKLGIARPKGETVKTTEEALAAAEHIGYPVLMRPSYVLGGQNMIIAFNEDDIKEYMAIILEQNVDNLVLIDKYLQGIELEIDAICDGEDILIPGIMEHIERAGIHSGDSIAVYPSYNINDDMVETIVETTKKLAVELETHGLVNIQYLIKDNKLYVIEVNPRSSRTIPYLSKVTGVPMVDLATRALLGEKLADMGYGTGLYPIPCYCAVKVPIFSFEKLLNVDNQLGPEMKSTGEVLGIGTSFEEAIYKGLVAAGYNLDKKGGLFVTVNDRDKSEIVHVVKKFADMGFEIYATAGTGKVLADASIDSFFVEKIHEGANNALKLMEQGKINFVISTSAKGRNPNKDSVITRRKAVERGIPCLTSIDTANVLADSLQSLYTQDSIELVDINNLRREPEKLKFTKMQSCGNDYIYFNCLEQHLDNPAGLAVRLCSRHRGVGGDGMVMICPSDKADVYVKVYNMDGSNGGIGGNAIRCVGKYLYDHKIVEKMNMTIETDYGVKQLSLIKRNGRVWGAAVSMGKPLLNPEALPMLVDGETFINQPITVQGKVYNATCLSVGNPHLVVFCDNPDQVPLKQIGWYFEHHEWFPERVNVEFVRVLGKRTLDMRVWERGNGYTSACGTGSCAAVVAAVLNGYCAKGDEITVKQPGGDLQISYDGENVIMTGSAENLFDGEVEI
ncbi:MAG TPA: carbamoyl-phosphate synthase large subunit [Candidatus Avidehalobacter gallistercoris]|uniref:Multifunctional fusion protein n=1 Tax=Candidatus Avidehalobacter gallistercoris TaxID=2840694 RepID=A0A9D1KX64_9FIRM|nr:carbamoyl-phosphate synthase large subunit [Candidatus Avidehalobacter gallistercoris]